MRNVKTAGSLAAVIFALTFSTMASGQTATAQNSFGVFAGFTDFDRGSTKPTLGLEFESDMQGPWSVGGIAEYSKTGYRGEQSTLAMGVLNYRPQTTPRLKLIGGAGYEFNRFGDDIRLRAGVGYDLVQGPVTLTPRLALNFGNGREDLVLGATAYFSF